MAEGEQKHIPLSTFIPGYIIEAKLGEGGMGAVYKARQISLNREVAIKILSPKLNKDPQYVARFQREAQIAGKLIHKNIVTVLETGVSHHNYYYVMEYVEGSSLHKILHKRKILPEQEAIKIIEEVAEALEHADKYKIIHRDIKPENIMMTKEGHAKLCDMGIAKQTQGELAKTLTLTGEGAFFTPYYVSPEQLTGEKLDIRTDIYSLGITLYEMVTGQLPFKGETSQEVASKRLTKSPIPPKKWNPKISQNLNNLILRMIARNREHRYANPTQLIKTIQQFKQGAHISAPPKPYTKWITLAAVALIAIVATTIFFTGGGKKEAELFNDTIANVEKSLTERKYSDAMKLLNTFKAKGEETKNRIKEYADKINTTAREGFNALITYSNSLFAKCDFDNAINVLVNAKSLYEATNSNSNLSSTITEVSKKIEERKTETKKFYDSAVVKYNRKDYKGALEDYNKAIQINPNLAEAYIYRGVVKGNLGDYKGELEDCSKAIQINPNDATAYNLRGIAKGDLGDYKGELEDCSKAISMNPNYADAYGNRGAAKSKLGDYKGALEDCSKAISIDPNDAVLYYNRGVEKYNLGDYEGAIADYDKAIQIDPNDATAYNNRGATEYHLGDWKGAIADWEKAIKLNSVYKSQLQSFIDQARAEINK